MRSVDVDAPGPVDHCLIHQFIRVHGRRPSREELAALYGQPRSRPAGNMRVPHVSTRSIRRAIAQMVSRS